MGRSLNRLHDGLDTGYETTLAWHNRPHWIVLAQIISGRGQLRQEHFGGDLHIARYEIAPLAWTGQVNYLSVAMNAIPARNRSRGRPRGFDREVALEAAMRLFWSRGYEATSITELIAVMGITPPSLYGAFGNKKRLFFEALDRYQAGPGCFAHKALTEEPTAERAMRRLVTNAVKSFTNPKNPRGCMVILAATNCAAESDDVMNTLAGRRRAAQAVVRERIAAGQAAGELAPGASADALAGLVTATLSGLAMLARDGASRASLLRIVDQMMSTWPRATVTTSPDSRV